MPIDRRDPFDDGSRSRRVWAGPAGPADLGHRPNVGLSGLVLIGALAVVVATDLFELSDDFAAAPARGLVQVATIAAAATAISFVARWHRRATSFAVAVAVAGLALAAAERLVGGATLDGHRDRWLAPVTLGSIAANTAVLVAAAVAARHARVAG